MKKSTPDEKRNGRSQIKQNPIFQREDKKDNAIEHQKRQSNLCHLDVSQHQKNKAVRGEEDYRGQ